MVRIAAVKRAQYKELIQYVAARNGISFNRGHVVIKELSKVLKECVERGDAIQCDGLFTISFTCNHGTIYKNRVIGLKEQAEMVRERLGIANTEDIIRGYYRRILRLVETGYQVNIKGVGYIIPKESDEGVYYMTRVSPVLNKPDLADFLLLRDSGALDLCQVSGDSLRFSMVLDEDVRTPCMVMKERELRFETVEI